MDMLSSTRTTPCGACKYQRRRCEPDCVFAPYFPVESIQRFACVHHVFGASNALAILRSVWPEWRRAEAAAALAYQAEARVRDPAYGCMGHVLYLEKRRREVQEELRKAQTALAQYMSPAAMREACPSLGASLKGKKSEAALPQVMAELGSSSNPIFCDDDDFEKWEPFPPWGDTSASEKVGPSSQMQLPPGAAEKGKTVPHSS